MEKRSLLISEKQRDEQTSNARGIWCVIGAVFLVVIWVYIDLLYALPNKTFRSYLWELKVRNIVDVEPYQIIMKSDQVPLLEGNVTFKRILFWNEAYGNKRFGIGSGADVLQQAGCRVWQCETTESRDLVAVNEFDAIVFHLRSWTQNDLPATRSVRQRYVFWSIESPAHRFVNTDLMEDFFNWTLTYRLDSDFPRPYGWIEPISTVPLHPDSDQLERLIAQTRNGLINYATGKKKMAAWFVSNCKAPSGRDEYVEALRNANISVDVFGACGNHTCPRSDADSCRKMVEQDYKFYLSFENSLCMDYITEKFFQIFKFNVIPIVLRGSHAKMVPPHSFINADDFETVEQLADYLITLDKNDTLYNEYFWWKPYFKVHGEARDFQRAMCDLCASLHDVERQPKIYHNMTNWWDIQANCTTQTVNHLNVTDNPRI